MWLARLSVLGFAYFMVALAALHALRGEYDPLEETVSQYSIGPHGYLMTTAFFAIGLGVVALAVALSRGVMPSPRIGPLLLGLAGVCVFLVGVFPVDPASAAMPISELAHDAAFMTSILAAIAAMFVLTHHFKRAPGWRWLGTVSMILSLATLAGLATFAVTYDTPWRGAVQRVCIVVIFSWLLMVATWLSSVRAPGARGPSNARRFHSGSPAEATNADVRPESSPRPLARRPSL